MTSPKLTSLLFLGLSLVFFMATPGKVSAQQVTRLSVSPVTFELTANPGDTLSNQIKVSNLSDSELLLETKVENIAGTGDQGQVQLTSEETSFSLSKWVTADASKFTLPAKETRTITFTIRVPTNAEPGGHYGSILVGTIASAATGSTGVGFGQKIGSLLLVKVSGEAEENAVITSIKPKPFTGEWEEKATADGKTKILVPKTDTLSNTKALTYFERGPIAFDLDINNLGNVHVKPSGFVTIYNVFHRKIAELPIDQRNVFPGNDRQIAVIWPKASLWGVYYRAEVAAIYGSTNQPLTASVGFWAFPKIPAIVIGVFLLLLLLARKRLVRALKILIKGA